MLNKIDYNNLINDIVAQKTWIFLNKTLLLALKRVHFKVRLKPINALGQL